MAKSMTGYGRAGFEMPTGPVRIEIKTTNHKYFDFSPRLPYALMSYEEQIRKMVGSKISRGKIYLNITTPDLLVRKTKLYVDQDLAKEYHRALKSLQRTLGIKDKISLQQIARMPDVITSSVSHKENQKVWNKIRLGIAKALKSLDVSRRKEGIVLQKDLLQRSQKIKKAYAIIQKKVPKKSADYEKGSDITEEIVRLGSHIMTFKKTIRSGGEMGRKIDFIAQEMMREINTTGAKSNDKEITKQVIEVKTELEKIREQAQNLE